MPSFMNHSCQRQTQVFDQPVRRMISLVPTPSALGDRRPPSVFLRGLTVPGDRFKSAAGRGLPPRGGMRERLASPFATGRSIVRATSRRLS